MSCFTPVIINGKEVVSKLQPQLLKILKTNPHIVLNEYEDLDSINDLREEHYEEIAGKSYNYFETSEFNDDFGDWQNDDTITKDKYEEMIESLKSIDLTKVVEMEDNTDLSGELACAGGACEIT